MQTQSRQYRRQMARLHAKVMGYTKKHREALMKQGPSYQPHRVGRPEMVYDPSVRVKVPSGKWISPKDYPRQSKRQAARYARH